MRGPQSQQYGASRVVLPHNLDGVHKWSWHHPDGKYNTLVSGGPVIDAAGSIFLTTNDGVRKFSRSGEVLWHHPQPNRHLNNQPALLGDKVFGSNEDGEAFALDSATGALSWKTKLAAKAGIDAGYPAASDGVFVAGADFGKDPLMSGGNAKIFGLDVRNGATLWQFQPEHPAWNFAPLFPGDDTMVFMDFTGGMYRLGLHNGTLLWHRPTLGQSFSDGGAVLGPNGNVYTCSNPGTGHGAENTWGLLRALSIADGSLLWRQLLPQPCNSYPAVGKLGPLQELSVAVTPGSFMGMPELHGSIMTFDAATGAPQWRFNAHPFNTAFKQAVGDVEGYQERRKYNGDHAICLPAHWSSANIAGDGSVYAARADGYLYGVKGPSNESALDARPVGLDKDFTSTPGVEVRVHKLGSAVLHGAFAFAPGTFAIATCDSLYVYDI